MRVPVIMELPAEIAHVARVMLANDEERFHFVSTVDRMRYRKLNGERISTKLLSETFGAPGRKRLVACFKECVDLGLLTCSGSYCAKSPGRHGFSKGYHLADHLVLAQDVAAVEVADDVSASQHGDALGGSAGGCCASKKPSQPIARCVYPCYEKVDEAVQTAVRKKLVAAMERLGWDCVTQDVTPQLRSSLTALVCPMTDADSVAYYHTKEYRQKGRRARTRINPATGQIVVKPLLSPEKMRERDIRNLQKSLRDLAVGDVWARRKNGRCYHTATDIPAVFRRRCHFVMDDGSLEPAVDVDVSSMWWWELSTMVKDTPGNAEERALLVQLFESGTFYEQLRSRMLVYGARLSEREQSDLGAFKRAVNVFILFGGEGPERRSLWGAFREALPGMADALSMLRRYNTPRQISFIFSRLEGAYTLDFVMTMMHDMGLHCIPYHDGCLVPESAVKTCIELYRRAMVAVHGHSPLIRAKGQVVTSEDLEAIIPDEEWFPEEME